MGAIRSDMSHKSFETVFNKGITAFYAGKGRNDFPYTDVRCGLNDRLNTWSRAYIYRWQAGWDYAKNFSEKAELSIPKERPIPLT